jgi:tRNA (guanine10-N2)-dimethyltransferase
LAHRAAYTKHCCKELFKCKMNEIAEAAKDVYFEEYLSHGESFRVLIEKGEYKVLRSAARLEEELGKEILDSVPGAKVDLVNPERTFFGLCVGESLLVGIAKGAGSRISLRRPSLRPFFRPSAMLPKLARCMVNLARAGPSDTVVDPFCGTGSLLVEAGLIGCKTVGLDVSEGMVRGASQNLRFFGVGDCGLIVGDARSLPFQVFDCVASDPPYGRTSSTHGVDARQLVEVFMQEALGILHSGGHLCLAFPKGQALPKLGEELGYVTVETHEIREHKSLTREIVVFRKP